MIHYSNKIVFNLFLSTIIIVFLFSSTTALSQINVVNKTVNFGMKTVDQRTIDVIIIHSTFNNSGGSKYDVDLIIKQFSHYNVSSHYLIDRTGIIYLLVDEKNIAYHAGVSKLPNGRTGLNSCSLGIELVNSFDESPTEEQFNSLIKLVKDIQKRHNISYILRHSDIAPVRKTDPWNFDWERFLLCISKTESPSLSIE